MDEGSYTYSCHLSAVGENPLAGVTGVREPASGDSLSSLCLALLIE